MLFNARHFVSGPKQEQEEQEEPGFLLDDLDVPFAAIRYFDSSPRRNDFQSKPSLHRIQLFFEPSLFPRLYFF